MKQYKISSWGFKIEEVEIARKTDRCIFYLHNGRERRESDTYYFDTWEQARQEIIDRNMRSVKNAELQLGYAKEGLEEALEIKI